MTYLRSSFFSIAFNAFFVIAALLLSPYGSFAQELTQGKSITRGQNAMSSGMGRLYVFREIQSFGADIDDDVTINAVPVQRLRPGMGFYCDVRPGSYVVSVLRHKTNSLNVSIARGQSQYMCVMLHRVGGESPRGGALTSDQSFDVHKLEPGYGAQRIQEYRLIHATCRLP
jgi:hypothetical protein